MEGKEMNELLSLDIRQLSKMIKSKKVSPVELVEILLDYVNKVDPQLNSFISLDQEQIIRDAYEKEREIKEGEYIGPLHGVPIGIKDNINTKDFKTTMASDIFKDYYPEEDALDRKSTRLNSSHVSISYAVFCLKKKTNTHNIS